MGFFQKIKQFLPVPSRSFYQRMDETECLFQRNSEAITRSLQELKQEFNVQKQVLQDLHTLALSRQAFLIQNLLPDFFSSEVLAEFDRKLQQPRDGRPEIPVVFITDSHYLLPAMTAASSLLRHSAPDVYYSVHVIGYKLSEGEIKKYSKLSAAINFQNLNRDFPPSLKKHIWVSPAALLKFDLPNLFPQYDKILYLDSDMLILDDLKELYDTDIQGCFAAVVKDKTAMELEHHHEKMKHQNYFNTGMMLLNLKKMREDNISAKLFEAKKNDPWKHFMDQDVFNQVFQEKVRYVSPTYNFMLGNLIQINSDFVKTGDFYRIPLKEMKQIFCRPAIHHLSNIDKPWFSPFSIAFECWQLEYMYLNRILALYEERKKTES